MKTVCRRVMNGVALGCGLLLIVSCGGPAYNRVWDASAPVGATVPDITGPWEGAWTSASNGHTGELRCVVSPLGENRYEFRYRATWAGVMKGNFRIECEAEERGGAVYVNGSKTLPPFGTYHHEGKLDGEAFTASFRSGEKDSGSFELKRAE